VTRENFRIAENIRSESPVNVAALERSYARIRLAFHAALRKAMQPASTPDYARFTRDPDRLMNSRARAEEHTSLTYNDRLMELPERAKQHKAESDSYAILLYKLRHIGIFRNMTENDYWIDFEIELVQGSLVTGNYFKAQVKSAQEVLVRKSDGIPTIGGIKQSTLNYWCELSMRTHVIGFRCEVLRQGDSGAWRWSDLLVLV
jgi:hypothetical protein